MDQKSPPGPSLGGGIFYPWGSKKCRDEIQAWLRDWLEVRDAMKMKDEVRF